MNEFVNANLTHCIDYASLSAIRMMLPPMYKAIELNPVCPNSLRTDLFTIVANRDHYVLIHPGKTWPSRTLPAEWWERVIVEIKSRGKTPVVIGNNTVELDLFIKAHDLRGKTTLEELTEVSNHE
jgi:ADP-heptose:LPS heptosyltransferase